MADHRDHYGGTLAPLVVNDLVIAGVGGGDEGIRGFLAAYKADTGEEAWRFWTVPLPGEPLSETWVGSVLPHGCAGTWLTGTYDPELDLLYWPTGNPCPDMNGDERQGDNLYSDSMLAIEPSTGKLRWHYQYTPHDLYDWDANQTPMLIDTEFQGSPRKLLVHANRNGFFYVLDRTNGEVLLAKPFVEKMTWATGIGSDGRPQKLPAKEPTYAGNEVCPSLAGATNWMSPSYSPSTGLVYVQTVEQCNIYTKRDERDRRGLPAPCPARETLQLASASGSLVRPPGERDFDPLPEFDFLDPGDLMLDVTQDGAILCRQASRERRMADLDPRRKVCLHFRRAPAFAVRNVHALAPLRVAVIGENFLGLQSVIDHRGAAELDLFRQVDRLSHPGTSQGRGLP
jgi:alcohol dehydrogenase (cytochrome c)